MTEEESTLVLVSETLIVPVLLNKINTTNGSKKQDGQRPFPKLRGIVVIRTEIPRLSERHFTPRLRCR